MSGGFLNSLQWVEGREGRFRVRQIKATDRQVDALVYELYGLTEEEIGVVEKRP